MDVSAAFVAGDTTVYTSGKPCAAQGEVMGYSPPSGWNTDENVALARELFKSGMGSAAVAARIGNGCTKNAIDGLAARRNWRGIRKNNPPSAAAIKTVWEGSVIASERREAGPEPLPAMSEISWGAIHPISWDGVDASLGDD